jgi:hypothetical protein
MISHLKIHQCEYMRYQHICFQFNLFHARFRALKPMTVNSGNFWDMTERNLAEESVLQLIYNFPNTERSLTYGLKVT